MVCILSGQPGLGKAMDIGQIPQCWPGRVNAGPSCNDSAPSEPYDTLRPRLIRQLAAIEVEHQQKAYPGARFCPTMFEAAIAEALYQTMSIQKQWSDRLAALMNPSDEPQVVEEKPQARHIKGPRRRGLPWGATNARF